MSVPQQHILVVEDEEHLAIGIKYNLEAEGYRVTTVGDGPAAITAIEGDHDHVDLVILDLMLPGMSGYAVCEALRAADNDVPVLILTARTLIEDRTRGFEVGADQYLTKPFDLDELITRVKGLLTLYRRRTGQKALPKGHYEEFAFGRGKVNFQTFECTVDGEPVAMTKLELRLLQYFVEHQGRVVPRQELLENVWKIPGQLQTRAVDQFIRRLRKIFEPDPAAPVHFLTVRDAGYRFVAQPEPQTPDGSKPLDEEKE